MKAAKEIEGLHDHFGFLIYLNVNQCEVNNSNLELEYPTWEMWGFRL